MEHWLENASRLMELVHHLVSWQCDTAALALPDLFVALARFQRPLCARDRDAGCGLDKFSNPNVAAAARGGSRLFPSVLTFVLLLHG